MSSAEQIGRSPNSHLAAAGRRPLPDLYDLVQGRENPAVICRCQKTGIGGKSGDHRTILKACDAAFNKRQEDIVAVLARVHTLLRNQSTCFPITTLLLRRK